MADKPEDEETGFETSSELRQRPEPRRRDKEEEAPRGPRRLYSIRLLLPAICIVLVCLILLLYFLTR
jgi:hypothetical protein